MELIGSAIERATSLQLRIRDCKSVLQHAQGFSNKRWITDQKCFRDLESDVPAQPHIVNTSTAISILCRYRDMFRPNNIRAFEGLAFRQVCQFYSTTYRRVDDGGMNFWNSKETNRWSPYVSSLVLTAIAECAILNGPSNFKPQLRELETLGDALKEQVKALQEYLQRWSRHNLPKQDADYDHAFFAYTAWTALASLGEAQYEDTEQLISKDLESWLITRFKLEFYSQMTFKLADIPQHLDATTLILSVYCLATLVRDREPLPGDVVDAALDTVFSLQQSSGFWSTATPLLGTATGRLGCSSVELANCLLRAPRLILHFERYQMHFDKLFNQLFKEFDILNPHRGWSVDIRRNGNARQTWYGFMVYEFIHLYTQRMSEEAATLILRGFRYTRDIPKFTWENIADYEGLKSQIDAAIVAPRTGAPPFADAKYSIIFFGPPGTGKTTIASALAHKLGWGMIEIGPGDFLQHGIDGIFAQGDTIFQRLLMLDQVVVLFDEVDELVQARENEKDKFSRFLTTYMLPWIQRLRDKASIVFIFATNRIEVFDPAIRRQGRFDLVLPLGPPQGKERARIIKTMKLGMGDSDLQVLADRIPPQATIGEIQDAVDRLRRLGEPTSSDAILNQIRTATSADNWTEFLKAAKLHAFALMGGGAA